MTSGMKIDIRGIVQGVGFRPFVYHLARQYHLFGYVRNDSSGVSIEVEGEKSGIEKFIAKIKTECPPVAVIFDIKNYDIEPVGYDDFIVRDSDDHEEKFVPISPEISTCSDCLAELFDPNDPRYRYPFINCTNCGPRFTIVKDIPYDRQWRPLKCAGCVRENTMTLKIEDFTPNPTHVRHAAPA